MQLHECVDPKKMAADCIALWTPQHIATLAFLGFTDHLAVLIYPTIITVSE